MTPVSLKIFICPLRKKIITKDKLDSKIFKHFVLKITTATKNGDVYPSSTQKWSKIDKLKSKNPLICLMVKVSKTIEQSWYSMSLSFPPLLKITLGSD